jgi:phage shock protein E
VFRRSTLPALVAVAALGLTACTDAGADELAEDGTTAAEAGEATIEVVDANEAVALLADRDDLTVIDVRTPEEHAEGHVAGTELIDAQSPDLTDRLDALDPDQAYLVYCRSGNRSAAVVAQMAERGFVEVYDAGGFDDLAAAGAPTGP